MRKTPLLLFVAASLASAFAAGRGEEPWTLPLAPPAPHDPGFPALLEGADSIRCGFCHETILREWAASLHALAWVDPRYQASLEGRRKPADCHGCHAPRPLFELLEAEGRLGTRPPVRAASSEPLEHGVSCLSCHQAPGGVMVGPLGIETDAHPTRRSELMSDAGSNELCAACHQTTVGPVIGVARDFLAARLDQRGMSCMGCHMQAVERPTATDDDDRPTPPRRGRSHALQSPRDPRFLAQAFELRAERRARTVAVLLSNRAGHRVPALDERELTFELELTSPAGVVSSARRVLSSAAPLATLETLELTLEGDGEAVRVRATRRFHEEEPLVFLESVLVPDAPAAVEAAQEER